MYAQTYVYVLDGLIHVSLLQACLTLYELFTCAQEVEQLSRLEPQLGDGLGSDPSTPFASPPTSLHEGSSGMSLFERAGHSGRRGHHDSSGSAMVLESGGVARSPGEIDVEGWDEGSGDVDLLLQDLQHSSSSSESDSESEL